MPTNIQGSLEVLTKNGNNIFPITTPRAIVEEGSSRTLDEIISSIESSDVFDNELATEYKFYPYGTYDADNIFYSTTGHRIQFHCTDTNSQHLPPYCSHGLLLTIKDGNSGNSTGQFLFSHEGVVFGRSQELTENNWEELDIMQLKKCLATPWSSTATYNPGDYVFHKNEIWRCKSSNTNIEPKAANPTDWGTTVLANLIKTLETKVSALETKVSALETKVGSVYQAYAEKNITIPGSSEITVDFGDILPEGAIIVGAQVRLGGFLLPYSQSGEQTWVTMTSTVCRGIIIKNTSTEWSGTQYPLKAVITYVL